MPQLARVIACKGIDAALQLIVVWGAKLRVKKLQKSHILIFTKQFLRPANVAPLAWAFLPYSRYTTERTILIYKLAIIYINTTQNKLSNSKGNLYVLLISFICDCPVQGNHLTNVMVEGVLVPSFLNFFLGGLTAVIDFKCFAIFTWRWWVRRGFFKPWLQFVFLEVFEDLQSHIIGWFCIVKFQRS